MTDITMCADKDCPNKDKCYRFKASPNDYWQSYFSKTPRESDYCDHYIGMEEEAMTVFKKGQVVECIHTGGERIKLGCKYEVLDSDAGWIDIIDEDNERIIVKASLFKADIEREDTLDPIADNEEEILEVPEEHNQVFSVDTVDQVNHPSHYTRGKIEIIDIIESLDLGYHLSNVIKYLARHNYKGKPKQDIDKAMWYLKRYRDNLDD